MQFAKQIVQNVFCLYCKFREISATFSKIHTFHKKLFYWHILQTDLAQINKLIVWLLPTILATMLYSVGHLLFISIPTIHAPTMYFQNSFTGTFCRKAMMKLSSVSPHF